MRLPLASLALLSLIACGGGAPGVTNSGGPSAPPAPAPPPTQFNRFTVTLTAHGAWGLTTEADGTCPDAGRGTDTLTGEVVRIGVDDEGVRYSGRLTRTTHVGLCETRETGDGTAWCPAALDGSGAFLVVITIPLRGRDNENASVVMKPDLNAKKLELAHADVSGNCDSLDNGDVKADYEDGDTLYFETANHAAARVMPTGGLVPGSWSQSRHDPDTGYKLGVAAVP